MKIFDKKVPKSEITTKEFVEQQKVNIMERPRICCIDLDQEIINKLKTVNLNVYAGSFGPKINVPNTAPHQYHQILLKNDIPKNILEFDILVIDLNSHTQINYDHKEHIRESHVGHNATYLVSRYPETLFDPKPVSSYILGSSLYKLKQRKLLIIIFGSADYAVDYQSAKTSGGQLVLDQTNRYGIYSFADIPISEISYGKEIIVCDIRTELAQFFKKYIKGSSFRQTFYHPAKYDKNHIRINDKHFVPLMKNLNEEIISYLHETENMDLLMLPDINDKKGFLEEFLLNIAPSIYPNYFPQLIKSDWKDIEEYWLPNHSVLIDEKRSLEEELKHKIEISKKKIEDNKIEFSFLHEMLIETGDPLVKSIIKFLKWLDFKKVEDYDSGKSNILEEDIQVEFSEGLIIIECKGIGGTSTDSDCNQISKIKHRRCKERHKFDVYALYIVNHQRYLPPLKRNNPPFSKEQIQDAFNEERGLVTTWQLFKLYFDIENGIISKEEARKSLLEFGLIEFKPNNLIYLDEPKEFFDNGSVCIIHLQNVGLNINDEILVEKNGRYKKGVILNIMKNGKPVSVASNGEFGIKVNLKVEKNSKLFRRN